VSDVSWCHVFRDCVIYLVVHFSDCVKDISWYHVFRDCFCCQRYIFVSCFQRLCQRYIMVSCFQRLFLLSKIYLDVMFLDTVLKIYLGVMFSEIVFVVKDITLCHVFRDCFCYQRYILVSCFQRLCQRYILVSCFQTVSKIYLGVMFAETVKNISFCVTPCYKNVYGSLIYIIIQAIKDCLLFSCLQRLCQIL